MVKPLLSKHVTKFLNTRHYQSWRVVFCTMVLVAKIRLFLHSTNYSFCYSLYYTSDIIFIPPPPLPFIPLPRLPLFHFHHHPYSASTTTLIPLSPPPSLHSPKIDVVDIGKSTSTTSVNRRRRRRFRGSGTKGKEDVPLPQLH